MTTPPARCDSAHQEDPTPCDDGNPRAVIVLGQVGGEVAGCEHHAARLLASLTHGRVYPLEGPATSAARVFNAAQDLPPFAWEPRP